MKKFSVKTIVAIGIGAALFFVLGRFVAIPSPVPNVNICVQYGLLAFMSVVYGPVAGALMGFIGHTLIDFSYGWGIWWSWVIASGVFGLLVGMSAKLLKMDEAEMGKKGLVKYTQKEYDNIKKAGNVTGFDESVVYLMNGDKGAPMKTCTVHTAASILPPPTEPSTPEGGAGTDTPATPETP